MSYSIASGKWTLIVDETRGRQLHTAAIDDNNMIYINAGVCNGKRRNNSISFRLN